MIWIAGIVVLVLFLIFPKKMAIVTGVVIVIGGAGIGVVLYPEWRDDKEKEKVEVTIEYSPQECEEQYPLKVRITNRSKSTVLKVEWDIKINRPGFSTDISDYGYHQYAQDKILKPKEGWQICYMVPKLNERIEDYSKLEYSIKNKYVTFKRDA
jgi:hypothetical protein